MNVASTAGGDDIRDGVQPGVQPHASRRCTGDYDLDEGHKVKNEDTAAHSVLSRVHRRTLCS